MKKYVYIALAVLLPVFTTDASAQSFLKRIGNAVERGVEKAVEKQVTKEVEKQVSKGFDKLDENQSREEKQSQPAPKSTNTSKEAYAVKYAPQAEAVIPYGPLTGALNGHKWVDMGLPSGTRWATCNVDASAPEQPGKHYSWGETVTKTSYAESNTKNYRKDVDDFSGDKVSDVATAKWGAGWKTPTYEQFSELVHYCNWKYVQKNGRWGAEITSPKTKNSIFLPASGAKDGAKHDEPNACGMYWTSTPYKSTVNNGAHDYHFGGALGEMGISERYYGYSVRPVIDYDVNTQIPSSGEINGHKWVDLGLPSGVKWATCNLGTDDVDQDGDYYSWGETIPYLDKSSGKNEMSGKQIGDISGNARYDAARALWGGTWRLPTEEEFIELMSNCTVELTSIGRRNGMKLTSKINGNYIFLPSSGEFIGSYSVYPRANDINSVASYWTSTPKRDSYYYDAYFFRIYEERYYMSAGKRNSGYSIRPVSD